MKQTLFFHYKITSKCTPQIDAELKFRKRKSNKADIKFDAIHLLLMFATNLDCQSMLGQTEFKCAKYKYIKSRIRKFVSFPCIYSIQIQLVFPTNLLFLAPFHFTIIFCLLVLKATFSSK